MERNKLTLDDCFDTVDKEINNSDLSKEELIDIEEVEIENAYEKIDKDLEDYMKNSFNNPESDLYNNTDKLNEFAVLKKNELDELDNRKKLLKESKEELKLAAINLCQRWEVYATITYCNWLSMYQTQINEWNKKYANQFMPCHESVLEMDRIKSSTKSEIIRCKDTATLIACIQEHIDICKKKLRSKDFIKLNVQEKVNKLKSLLESFDLNYYLDLIEKC